MSNSHKSFISKIKRRNYGQEKYVPIEFRDKIYSRNFVAKYNVKLPCLYQNIATPLHIKWNELPTSFVIKPSRGCSSKAVMPLHTISDNCYVNTFNPKKELTTDDITQRQLQYYNKLKPQLQQKYSLIVEEFLKQDRDNTTFYYPPEDFKCFCFFGKVGLISQKNVNLGQKNAKRIWYDDKWNILGQDFTDEDHQMNIPSCKDEIIETCKYLSSKINTPFVRIDVYATDRGCVFGEFTLAPGGLNQQFYQDQKIDTMLYEYWMDAKQRLSQI